jgi:hypothetical protein
VIKAIVGWWRARQRSIDLQILWPACKDGARDLDHAKAAFAVHALHDEAWLHLGRAEVARRIGELT